MTVACRPALLLAVVALCLPTLLHAAEMEGQPPEVKLQPIVVGNPERIEVTPASFKLETPRRQLRIVVDGIYANGHTQDLTRAAKLETSNPGIAKIENGIVLPVANGTAEIKVTVGGHTQSVKLEVSGQEHADPIPFEYGTLVALTKAGCNMGACHGSPSGKGGFRLSLRGYDPKLDEETLVREAFNRRTNVFDPDASLILKKPLMKVAHGGGRRLLEGSPAHQLLRTWIAEGLRLDKPDAPRCTKVEVYPKKRTYHWPAHTQQLRVLAHFTDGSVRDVTRVACFSSSDEAVAVVNDEGMVAAMERGETAVLVRYLEQMDTAYLTFLKDVPGFAWNNPPENNYVDTLTFNKLQTLQIVPSELTTDGEFVRRVYLDVIGLLPTPEETQRFLDDKSADKRSKLIDELLARPEYPEFWSLRWGDLLRVNKKQVTDAGVHKFRHWILAAIRDNMPYDQFLRQLLTATGSTFDNPPANYFRTAGDTNDCTETTAQVFLGIRIQCAKCHNHPFERWTQDNYYGIGAFFNRVERKKTANTDELVVWVKRSGEITQPRTGQRMAPWLPLAGDAKIDADSDRRDALVEWMTQADNPYVARVEVNRIWSYLLGRGIIEPIDDFRDSNPPANKELLDALAADFVKHSYDRKYIIRTILNSRVYQLSSKANPLNKDDQKYFSHARTRLMQAEQLLDAICQVTGVNEKYKGLPAGTRAIELPSPDVDNSFLKVFGQPPREMACACERSGDSNLSQALQMINGPLVHAKLRDKNNQLRQLTKAGKSDSDIVSQLYLAALSRSPSETESQAALAYIQAQPDRETALEDVLWAILNAKEFLFQH